MLKVLKMSSVKTVIDKIKNDGITIAELARRIGVDSSSLGKIIRGKRKARPELIIKINKYFEERKK